MFAVTIEAGECLAMPDVCNTPAPPSPSPESAAHQSTVVSMLPT